MTPNNRTGHMPGGSQACLAHALRDNALVQEPFNHFWAVPPGASVGEEPLVPTALHVYINKVKSYLNVKDFRLVQGAEYRETTLAMSDGGCATGHGVEA